MVNSTNSCLYSYPWCVVNCFQACGCLFYSSAGEKISSWTIWRKGFWLVKICFYICGFIFSFQGAWLFNNMFYSFCTNLPFSQHLVNVMFFQPKRLLAEFFFLDVLIYIFIYFAGECIWNKLGNQKRFQLKLYNNYGLNIDNHHFS